MTAATKTTRKTKAEKSAAIVASIRAFGETMAAAPAAPIFEIPAETRRLWNLIIAAK